MCLICVEYEAERMNIYEANKAVTEATDYHNEEHESQVIEFLIEDAKYEIILPDFED
jgi:hypothetical protein